MINNAKTIWTDKVCVNQYIQAKKSFNIDKIPSACKISIYADAEYVLFLNGKFIGTGQYRTFPGKRAYDEYEVADALVNGENTINICAYSQQEHCLNYATNNAVLAFSVDGDGILVISDEETMVREHPYYKSGEIEKITGQLGFSYYFDAGKEETEWKKATVVDDGNQEIVKRPVKKLVHKNLEEGNIISQGYIKRERDGNPAERIQYDYMSFDYKDKVFNGKIISKNADGVYFVIDLEDELAGLLHMSLKASKGTVIDIGYGEHIEDLRVRAKISQRNFGVKYICKDGEQDFTGYFKRLAGRYLQIHISNMTGDITFEKIGLIPTEYPLDRIGYFKSQDYLMNKIYDISIKTLRLCIHEHYEDCPWREQGLYGFDSLVQMLCGYYVFGEFDFARESLNLLAEGARPDGLLQMCAPSSTKITIPSFCLAWVLSVEKYVLYSGDIEFGKKMMPVIKNMLDSFDFENNLIKRSQNPEHWHFYEWTLGFDGYGEQNYTTDAMANLYFIAACQSYNKLCEWSGSEKYDADIESIKKAVVDTFINKETGFLRTFKEKELYHEYTQSLAYYTGTLTDERIVEALAKRDNGLIKCTLSTSMYKYEILLSQGDKYLESVMDEIADIWGAMVFSGASSMWEVKEGAEAFERAGSLCHGWSALPIYLIHKYYLGFEPLTPGYKEYKFEPVITKHLGKIETDMFTPEWTKRV